MQRIATPMLRRAQRWGVMLLLVGLVAACAPLQEPLGSAFDTPGVSASETPAQAPTTPANADPGQIMVTGQLVAALRSAGLQVTPAGVVTQPFLDDLEGPVYQLGSGELQVFEFPDAKGPAFYAESIQPDGTIPGMQITWIAQPHFYAHGLMLAIYVGDDPQTLKALAELMGPPFAEGTPR